MNLLVTPTPSGWIVTDDSGEILAVVSYNLCPDALAELLHNSSRMAAEFSDDLQPELFPQR